MSVHVFQSTRDVTVVFLDIFTFAVVKHGGGMIQIKESLCVDIFGCVEIINCGQGFKFFIALENIWKRAVSEERLKCVRSCYT